MIRGSRWAAAGVTVLLNVVALVVFWFLSFGLIQVAQRFLDGWPAEHSAEVLGSLVGVFIALRLKARLAAYFIAAMAAFNLAELVIHAVYGIRAAQGAPSHFAVMGAAVLGVAFGALLLSYTSRGSDPVISATSP